MKKLLTICLVTANRPIELRQALLSVKEQKYRSYDLIIADDSDNDKTEKIVKEICPDALYFRNKPPLREILNTNKCISLSKTEYVCLFHDDDLLDKNYLAEIMPALKKDADLDMAFTGRIIVDQDNKTIARQVMRNSQFAFKFLAQRILQFMLLGNNYPCYRVFINTPGLVFKKSIFEKINGFDINIDTHCDTDFILRSLSVSYKVLFVNKPLYINKIWYGVSGRTKSSERGEVFQAEKGVIDNFLNFCKKNSFRYFLLHQKEIYRHYSDSCIAINGPMSWISVRFKGNYSDKVRHINQTFRDLVSINPKNIFKPKLYFIYLLSVLTPQFVSRFALKYLLRIYNDKS